MARIQSSLSYRLEVARALENEDQLFPRELGLDCWVAVVGGDLDDWIAYQAIPAGPFVWSEESFWFSVCVIVSPTLKVTPISFLV
jgi:hypothetical protein